MGQGPKWCVNGQLESRAPGHMDNFDWFSIRDELGAIGGLSLVEF